MTALFRYTVATAVATWLLLVVGGTVNPTGSSLACPDWYFVPTCYGDVVPADWSGGVLYEHGHRMLASLVGLLTVGLAVWLQLRRGVDRATRGLGWLAVVLVAVQGTLGGVTVLVGLSATLSTLHLAAGIGFLCLLVGLAMRVRRLDGDGAGAVATPRAEGEPGRDGAAYGWIVAAAVLVAAQILLGGLVRHLGAGLICGDAWPGCGPSGAWPQAALAQLHMGHRFLGYAVALVTLAASWQTARRAAGSGQRALARLATLPGALVVLQAALGIATVLTVRAVAVVALHTAVAGLLLASLLVVALSMAPRRAEVGLRPPTPRERTHYAEAAS